MSYEALAAILIEALNQAKHGKGKERHDNGKPFSEQPMMVIRNAVGSGFTLGQAMKKIEECQRLPEDRKVAELQGAIIYLAAEILATKTESDAQKTGKESTYDEE